MKPDTLIEKTEEIDDKLRSISMTPDLQSLKVVTKWLSGLDIPYIACAIPLDF